MLTAAVQGRPLTMCASALMASPYSPKYHYFLAPQGKSLPLWRILSFLCVSALGTASKLRWLQNAGPWFDTPAAYLGSRGAWVWVSCVCKGGSLLKKGSTKPTIKLTLIRTQNLGVLKPGAFTSLVWDPTIHGTDAKVIRATCTPYSQTAGIFQVACTRE